MSSIDPRHAEVARALLDGLTALDPTDPAASQRAIPLALQGLERTAQEDPSSLVFGAMILANGLVQLVSRTKNLERLDVIAMVRPVFERSSNGPQAR